MTLVGCYPSQKNLTECSYHQFEYKTSPATSMDIRITCGKESATPAEQIAAVANASLSISVILALAVVVLVAILIILVILRFKKKRIAR